MRDDVIEAMLAALAWHRGSSYLGMVDPAGPLWKPVGWDGRMVHPVSTQNATMSVHRRFGGTGSAAVVGVAVVCTSLLFGAALLWVHYGTAVFFEMIASGVAACI
jgi:hypothetical protein